MSFGFLNLAEFCNVHYATKVCGCRANTSTMACTVLTVSLLSVVNFGHPLHITDS